METRLLSVPPLMIEANHSTRIYSRSIKLQYPPHRKEINVIPCSQSPVGGINRYTVLRLPPAKVTQ